MPFTPEEDKDEAWKRIRYDPYILEYLDLTGTSLTAKANAYIAKHAGTSLADAKNLVIAKAIIRRSQYEDLADGEKRICIYFRLSRDSGFDFWSENVLQIDCHVPATSDYIADRIQGRIKTLLHKFILNGRLMQFDGQVGELASMSGFYCAGTRFSFYSTN